MSSFLKSTKTPPSKNKTPTPNQTIVSDCYGIGRLKTDVTNAKSANSAEIDLLENHKQLRRNRVSDLDLNLRCQKASFFNTSGAKSNNKTSQQLDTEKDEPFSIHVTETLKEEDESFTSE